MPGSGRSPKAENGSASSIPAWEIWTQESGWLQSMGSQESDITEHVDGGRVGVGVGREACFLCRFQI